VGQLNLCDAQVDVRVHQLEPRARELRFGVGHLHQGGTTAAEQLAPHAVAFIGCRQRLLRDRDGEARVALVAEGVGHFELEAVEQRLAIGGKLGGSRVE
jgi:hypothetical protein